MIWLGGAKQNRPRRVLFCPPVFPPFVRYFSRHVEFRAFPHSPPLSSQALVQYSIAEIEAGVARGEGFATGGTGDVFRGFIRGLPVAIKRVA